MTKAEQRYECDCCGKRAPLTRCWYAGSIETYACDQCREDDNMNKYFELSGDPAAVEAAERWLTDVMDWNRRRPTTLMELEYAWRLMRAKTLANQKDHDEEERGDYR